MEGEEYPDWGGEASWHCVGTAGKLAGTFQSVAQILAVRFPCSGGRSANSLLV